jgi:CheY-like chemotaxis protein
VDDITGRFDDTDQRPKVLVVDSSPNLSSVMREILAEQGFHVDIANNAAMALDMMRTGRYDCVVTDYNLPEMDGIDFVRMIRDSYGDLPIVLMSQDREASRRSVNVARYLQKPFHGDQLVTTLRDSIAPPQYEAAPTLH